MTNREKATLAKRLAAEELNLRVLYVSTYPPRECGIATYTKDLTTAINILNPYCLADIIAIDDEKCGGQRNSYPWEVKFKIEQNNPRSWKKAADYINQSSADVINIQHEYGIYGGKENGYGANFIKQLKKPVVTCFHTVLPSPNDEIIKATQEIVKLSDGIIVISDTAGQLLADRYGANPAKIVTIPHGVPDIPFGGTETFKKKLGYAGWNTITSFGLLGESKGYEHIIQAMPKILKKHPKTKLLLVGQTHPVVARRVGEVYRERLEKLVKDLKIENNVEFVNKYLSTSKIIEYLRATDIYVTPYPNLNQVSSGTLSYAVSAGLACISTRYVYANEVLQDGRGLLLDKLSHNELAQKAIFLLDNPNKRREIARKAYKQGRFSIWPRVALNHLDIFEIVSDNNAKK